MITEEQLKEINGLVARFYWAKTQYPERLMLAEKLRQLGVELDKPRARFVD